MKLKIPLVIAAVYMALVAIGHLVAPVALSAGVVSPDASPGMVAFLRHYGALFAGLAVLNWRARNEAVSSARDTIVFANVVVFGLGATLDVVAVLRGAGLAGLAPATINLAIATAFLLGRRDR